MRTISLNNNLEVQEAFQKQGLTFLQSSIFLVSLTKFGAGEEVVWREFLWCGMSGANSFFLTLDNQKFSEPYSRMSVIKNYEQLHLIDGSYLRYECDCDCFRCLLPLSQLTVEECIREVPILELVS